MAKKNVTKIAGQANYPVVWFCVLERARRANDFELALRAEEKLRYLGVTVKYHKTGGDDDA